MNWYARKPLSPLRQFFQQKDENGRPLSELNRLNASEEPKNSPIQRHDAEIRNHLGGETEKAVNEELRKERGGIARYRSEKSADNLNSRRHYFPSALSDDQKRAYQSIQKEREMALESKRNAEKGSKH